jgi:hypothetical protein
MSASPLSATPLSSIDAASVNAANPAAFLPANGDVQARLLPLQDKRSLLLKHIAQSERLAEVRPASRLETKPRPEMISSGVAEVDAITGGIPRGCLTEIWGGASSGKTSVLVAAMATATRRGETCVLIDASDSFDPASGEAAGINFGKLLWVRCGGRKPSHVARRTSHATSHGTDDSSFRNSRQLSATGHQENQRKKINKQSQRRLEQMLKATDLILQSGGFGLIVLDLAGIGEKFVRRIPLASWFRFQRAVEYTKSALIVVSETPCAQTCATLSLKQFSVMSGQWSGKPAHAEILECMSVQMEAVRSRLERKPSQSVSAKFVTRAVRVG